MSGEDTAVKIRISKAAQEIIGPVKTIVEMHPELDVVVNAIAAALSATAPYLRKQGDFLVTVQTEGPAIIVTRMNKHALDMVASRHIRFVIKVKAKKGEGTGTKDKVVGVPMRHLEAFLATPSIWRQKRLVSTTVAPLLAKDEAGRWSIFTGTGDKNGVFYHSPEIAVPTYSDKVAKRAIGELRRYIETIPFEGADINLDSWRIKRGSPMTPSEAAYLIAGMATACAFAGFDVVPGLGLSAPVHGGSRIGKSKAQTSLGLLGLGVRPHLLNFNNRALTEEGIKRLEGALLRGASMVVLDNLNRSALTGDSNLATLLSERPVNLRPLGGSRIVDLDRAVMFLFNGNGLSLDGDLIGRTYMARLSLPIANPATRVFEETLQDTFRKNRMAILERVLGIIQWGIAQGFDAQRSDFPDWDLLIRQPFVALGCPDPNAQREERMENNEAANLFEHFCLKVWTRIGPGPHDIEDLNAEERGTLWECIMEEGELRRHAEMPDPDSLLLRFKKRGHSGGVFGGFKVVQHPRPHGGARASLELEWVDQRSAPPPAGTPKKKPTRMADIVKSHAKPARR